MNYEQEKHVSKNLLVISITILFFSISLSSFSTAVYTLNNSYMQISNGNTLYVGGTGEGNYTMIQEAIDNASDGDTVYVYDESSPYHENVMISKSINLVGENRNTTIVDGNYSKNVVNISVDRVTIKELTIQNSGDEYFTDAGITIYSNFNTIKDNIISNNENGIYLLGSEFNTIYNNIITLNNEEGIFLWSYNNTISKNNISLNRNYGIRILDCKNNIIMNNIINRNGYWGDWIWSGGGLNVGNSSNNTIFGNEISKNCLFGITLLHYSNYNIIKGNKITNHNSLGGIVIQFNSDNNSIEGNAISKNLGGISIADSNKNNILKNNFFNNKPNALFGDCTNVWGKNYWNRPRILPKLIFGMVKINSRYRLHINIDWFPAKKPYEI